jgi:hypothetical protein
MKNMDRVIFGRLLALTLGLGFVFSANALACTTTNWDDASGGIAASPSAVSRYSEKCAFAITDGSYVVSTKANDSRYIARFYVLDGLTGSGNVEIFEAYSDDGAASPLFKVLFDGSQFVFDASDATGGGTSAPVASANGWNLVEIDWAADGSFKYWVNADAAVDPETGSVNAGSGNVQAILLGAPNGIGTQNGKLTFDAFESHRTTPVGALLAADANNDGAINILDLGNVRIELLNPGAEELLAIGQPDCNSDGSINILDVGCVRLILLN